MKNTIRTGLLCLALVILAACGRRSVDESLLPTAIPTLDANNLSAAVEPATATTQAETGTPTPIVDEDVTTVTEETTPPETPTTESSALTTTATITAETALTETIPITLGTNGEALTSTAEISGVASVSESTEITATVDLHDDISDDVGITTTDEITISESISTPAPSAPVTSPGNVTETEDMDESAGEVEPENRPEADTEEDEETTQDTAIYAGLPENIATALAQADPVHGQQLTLQNGCIGCHNVDPTITMAGPTWHDMGNTAAMRVEGENAAHYLYNSIVHPNDYIVEGFPPGLMIQTFAETISEQDLADIIAYLLTLRDE